MPDDDKSFAIFTEEYDGPVFYEFFKTREEAKAKAQELSDRKRLPVLIFSFIERKEVGWVRPGKAAKAQG